MKDIVTPVPPEEVKGVIRKCLEQAAQLNYQRIKEYAKIEGKRTPDTPCDNANDANNASREEPEHVSLYLCCCFDSPSGCVRKLPPPTPPPTPRLPVCTCC